MKEVKEEWVKVYKNSEEGFDFPFERKTLLEIFFESGSFVLEAGCGDGNVCFELEKREIRSLGIDITPNVVKQAHLFCKAKGYSVEFIIGDVTHLPLRNGSFDGVVSLGVIEHFRSTNQAFHAFLESHRVLRKDGKIFVTVPNVFVPLRNKLILFLSRGKLGLYHKFYTINILTKLLRSSGFVQLTYDVIDLWLPIFSVIDGLMKNLNIHKQVRRKTYYFFAMLPRVPFLKIFLGHVLLAARKN